MISKQEKNIINGKDIEFIRLFKDNVMILVKNKTFWLPIDELIRILKEIDFECKPKIKRVYLKQYRGETDE
jgi:uncharacterized pyridoxamine 5'-phosphate oxidase family protein